MNLRHIVAAADESDAGRQAVRTGADTTIRASARLTVLHAVPTIAAPVLAGAREREDVHTEHLQRWLEADVLRPDDRHGVETAIVYGVPGIEICRYAEARAADLLVLGRKPRSSMTRLLLGDTSDAVARRSRLPCLFVPPGAGPIRRLLVALDATDRGLRVLDAACGFARSVDAALSVVTVEQQPAGEPAHLAGTLPVERSRRLRSQVRLVVGRQSMDAATPVKVRRGPVVEEVLKEAARSGADALVVGYHRGGPSGVIDAGSTARHLAHVAPCAVLTVPL